MKHDEEEWQVGSKKHGGAVGCMVRERQSFEGQGEYSFRQRYQLSTKTLRKETSFGNFQGKAKRPWWQESVRQKEELLEERSGPEPKPDHIEPPQFNSVQSLNHAPLFATP